MSNSAARRLSSDLASAWLKLSILFGMVTGFAVGGLLCLALPLAILCALVEGARAAGGAASVYLAAGIAAIAWLLVSEERK